MENKYLEFKKKQQEEINKLPLHFAFGQKRIKELLKQLNAQPHEIYSIGSGGFVLKKDYPLVEKTFERQKKELHTFLEDEINLYQAITYEMANHEYCITYDDEEVLSALDIKLSVLYKNEKLYAVFQKAKENYLRQDFYFY